MQQPALSSKATSHWGVRSRMRSANVAAAGLAGGEEADMLSARPCRTARATPSALSSVGLGTVASSLRQAARLLGCPAAAAAAA